MAIVCAARTGIGDEVLAGLPELFVGGLGDSDALALLLENLQGPLDAAVSRRIVAESHGNPLALLEFPRTWSVAEFAGGFGLPEGLRVAGRIEDSYVRRLQRLPSDTQLLVLAAAAEPIGDPVLLQRAAESLEIDMATADAAADAGLLTGSQDASSSRTHSSGPRPTARRRPTTGTVSIVHWPTSPTPRPTPTEGRGTVHARPEVPTRRSPLSWNDPLDRAQARGGVAAAAAFLQRAVELTETPGAPRRTGTRGSGDEPAGRRIRRAPAD